MKGVEVNGKKGEANGEVVAKPVGNFCERVGGAGGDEDNVCPAPELDVEDWVADLVAWLETGSKY
jgi:hypothetical protein